MKIGFNMLLWTDHFTSQYYGIVDKLKEVGYQGVEIPLGDGDATHYKSIGNHLSGVQMEATCVTSLLQDTNIASPNPTIRAAGLDRLKWAIDMGHATNAKVICGAFHSAFAYFTRQAPTSDERKWSIENLHKAGEYAQQAEIVLALEALNRFECYLVNTMEDLKELIDGVDHPNVRGMYDTHHANIEEKSQKEAILTIRPYLKHIHISENDRGTPGKGQVNWDEVFRTLKEMNYDGWLTIESFSTIAPDFANAINVWRDFSPYEEVYERGYEFIKSKWNS